MNSVVLQTQDMLPAVEYAVIGDQPYPSFEVINILRYMELEHPEEVTNILKFCKLTQADLNEPFIPTYKVLACLEYCANNYSPALAIKIGTTYSVSDMGPFGYGIASCDSLGQAMEFTGRYSALMGTLVEKCVQVKNNELMAEYYNTQNLSEATQSFFICLGMSAKLSIARHLFGDHIRFRHISFTFNDDMQRSIYEHFFGCPIVFGSDRNGWIADSAIMKTTPHRRIIGNTSEYSRYCNELLIRIQQQNSLVNEIQQMLVTSAGDYPDIEMVATAFNVSSRTLRRRLCDVGTSFQKILNSVRCQLAIKYLLKSELTIDDISRRLGFGDTTNFRHAFKKWLGKSPTHYRKIYSN